jgi:predicted nucleic acid-binding Zn ribbon protein
MRRLSDVLPGVAAQLGLEAQLREAQAIASWERLVSELVPAAAGASRLLEIRPPQLVVSADDAITAQELRLRSEQLLAAFATTPGGSRLLELRITVRPPPPGGANGRFGQPV